jgi:hypothetical protein
VAEDVGVNGIIIFIRTLKKQCGRRGMNNLIQDRDKWRAALVKMAIKLSAT